MRRHLLAHNDDDHPALYVGTYRKYNNGSLAGAWLDLASFADYEDFMECCRELHNDEQEPELMMQDYMNFPREFYSESSFSEENFDRIREFWLLDSKEQDAFYCYLSCFGADHAYSDDLISHFREHYMGEWDSEEDFARHIVDECGMLDKMSESLQPYFDYEAFARDLFLTDYYYDSGFVFIR